MKNATLIFGLLMAAGFSTTASAHDYGGTLGSAASATDKFYITCAAGTAKFTYQIRRNAGTPKVAAKSTVPVGAVTTATKTGTFSPLITVNTSSGAKFFQVNKNPAASGTNSYTLRMHCYDANNLHDPNDQPSSVTYIQNQ
ncbi:hypothetical protein MCAMS1_00501 [biofilm metagenome]